MSWFKVKDDLILVDLDPKHPHEPLMAICRENGEPVGILVGEINLANPSDNKFGIKLLDGGTEKDVEAIATTSEARAFIKHTIDRIAKKEHARFKKEIEEAREKEQDNDLER